MSQQEGHMADTEQIAEPTDLLSYLSSPVESPSDAPSTEDLQPPADAEHDDQSSPEESESANSDDAEQPGKQESDEGQSQDAGTTDPEPSDAATVNWDSEENPHLKAAQQLEALRQFAERQKAETEAKEARDRLITAGVKLGEIDEEDDRRLLMDDLIEEISETAVRPYTQQLQTLEQGFASVVAAIKTLPAEQQEHVKKVASEYRELGQTAEEIERAFTISDRERSAAKEREKSLQTQVKNLTAQLAALAIQNSGEDHTETTAVGGAQDEPSSIRDMLRSGGPL
jgi:hypothetical protein